MEPRRPVIKDDKFYQRLLDRCSQSLTVDLDPTPLLDTFLAEEILEYPAVRDIQELPFTSAKNRAILGIFRGRGGLGYDQLKYCLKKAEQRHLVDTLLKAESELEKIIEMEQRQMSEQREMSGMGFIQRIPDDEDLNQIAQYIGFNWEFLGPKLGVKGSQIEQFKMNNPGNVKMQIFKMLQQWRQSGGSGQTMEKLLEILKSARSYVTIDWEDIKGIAENPPHENRNSDHQRTGDYSRDTVHPTERENVMPSVSNTPDQQQEQNMYPVQYDVTQPEHHTPQLKSVETATPPQGGRPEDLSFNFANTRRTGEDYSNLHQADLSGQSNMPDGAVNSVKTSPDGDRVDAGREQFVPSAQVLYSRMPAKQSSTLKTSNYDQRKQPVAETSFSHQDSNQRTKDSPETAIEKIKNILDNVIGSNSHSDTAQTVKAVPPESLSQISNDVVDFPQSALKQKMKERVMKELSQTPHDGRLLRYSNDTFNYIIGEYPVPVTTGGFGKVYAYEKKLDGLGIPVVVKIIELGKETDKCREKMMSVTNEKLASRTMHFAIVPLLAMTEDSNSTFYFLTPFIKNGDLDMAIRKDTDTMNSSTDLGSDNLSTVKMNSKTRLKIIYQVNSALDYLHKPVKNFRQVIVHGDLKTKNIVLDEWYNARLIDFGLAREMNEASTGITVSTMRGTRGYMPTTFIKSLRVEDDLHNFGIVIRELLTGKPAFDENTEHELRSDDKEEVFVDIQPVWYKTMKPSKEAEKLNDLADQCIEKKISSTELKEQIEELLPAQNAKWTRDKEPDRCETCMVNKAVSMSKEIPRHAINCTCKISVCVSCMRNSVLNPIICHTCGEEIPSIVGNGWGALIIAGNDVKQPTLAMGFVKDISELEDVLVSKFPLVMGIDERKVQVVKPSTPGTGEKLLDNLEKAVKTLMLDGNIHTLLIYFSGHYFPESGFQLGDKDEFLSVEYLQEKMEDIARSKTSTEKPSSHLSDIRFLIFLDCCAGPNLTDKIKDIHIGDGDDCGKTEIDDVQPNIDEKKPPNDVKTELPKLKLQKRKCIIQLNASRYCEKTIGTEHGSSFAHFFVQALTQRALKTECRYGKHCHKCTMTGDFITIQELHRYIYNHMLEDPKNGHPVLYVDEALLYDSVIAYNVDFHIQFEFRLKGNANTETVRLQRMYSKIHDLRMYLFQRLMETKKRGVPNFDIANYKPFVDSICIEIDKGPTVTEELDTIPKVMAAWNSRRDLKVSLRTDKNIHRGMVLKGMNTVSAGSGEGSKIVCEIRQFISTKRLATFDDPLYQSFVLPYKNIGVWVDNLKQTNGSSAELKKCLVSVRSCMKKNIKKVGTDDSTELHITFPKAVNGIEEDFICFELKNLKQKES